MENNCLLISDSRIQCTKDVKALLYDELDWSQNMPKSTIIAIRYGRSMGRWADTLSFKKTDYYTLQYIYYIGSFLATPKGCLWSIIQFHFE